MTMRSLMIASVAAIAAMIAAPALAEAPNFSAFDGATFSERGATGPTLNLSIGPERTDRSANFAPYAERGEGRRYEMALGARGVGGIDVALAQHASIGDDGDSSRHGRGTELRLGRGVNMPRQKQADWTHPVWYAFAAADDEAVTWRPGNRNAFGDRGPSFALQDRVEIGDRQAGVTYERGPLQASMAYVERSVEARSNGRTISRDERFVGLTLTMRH